MSGCVQNSVIDHVCEILQRVTSSIIQNAFVGPSPPVNVDGGDGKISARTAPKMQEISRDIHLDVVEYPLAVSDMRVVITAGVREVGLRRTAATCETAPTLRVIPSLHGDGVEDDDDDDDESRQIFACAQRATSIEFPIQSRRRRRRLPPSGAEAEHDTRKHPCKYARRRRLLADFLAPSFLGDLCGDVARVFGFGFAPRSFVPLRGNRFATSLARDSLIERQRRQKCHTLEYLFGGAQISEGWW